MLLPALVVALAMKVVGVVLVNLEGYWTPLLNLLDYQTAAGYLRPRERGIFRVVEEVAAVFDAMADAPTPRLSSDSDRM